ncbi:hypothetical protein CRE_13731 [Caenorhabditis remanei]|uniref:Uncharacterized protein n=1 Tax=Caenorhabditis remanei TaxID=31234 RepID=E3NEW6_CAERE|nr:hypothetical protein CRE_13731 [Caenorhabditis remanei]
MDGAEDLERGRTSSSDYNLSYNHQHLDNQMDDTEGLATKWKRTKGVTLCLLRLERRRSERNRTNGIVYDAECVVVKSGEYSDDPCRGPKHMPNMIVAHMFCNECRGKAGFPNCEEPIIFSYKDDDDKEDYDDDDHRFAGEEEGSESDSECSMDEFESEERSKTLIKFSKFLMTDPRANGAYVINGGRYDHVMLMADMD